MGKPLDSQKKLYQVLKLCETLVARSGSDLMQIVKDFEACFHKAILKIEKSETTEAYASGFFEIQSISFRVFLAPRYIDFSGAATTNAEMAFIHNRGGRTDVYDLKIQYESGGGAEMVSNTVAEKLHSLYQSFLGLTQAIPWDGKRYARSDY